jgi:hypothetical protein
MNLSFASILKHWTAPLTGVLSITLVSIAPAALVAPNTPEVSAVVLGGTSFAADSSLAGWVVGDRTVGFNEPSNLFQGTLRTVVVQNFGGTLDFYFQLANTSNLAPVSTGPNLGADIFRFSLSGFTGYGTGAGDALEIAYRTDGLAGALGIGPVNVGTNAPYSADRDPALAGLGGVGIDFDPSQFLGGAGNLDSGDLSQFLLIRTSARFFQSVHSEIVSGFGTALTSGFAPVAVPEPATALAGLALGSFVALRDLGRGRRRKPTAIV